MNLPSKSSRSRRGALAYKSGYAMAALLIAMSVMAVLLSIAMPTWSHMIRREKEEELIFRGEQYARAINQYQRKYANQSPASIDVLIEQRLLRKKFRDPFATDKEGEFQLLYVQNQMPGAGQGQPPGTTGGLSGAGTQGTQGSGARGTGSSTQGASGIGPGTGSAIGPTPFGKGPIVGVASKNTGQSIRLYKGKNRYNEWQFIGMEMSSRAGGGGPGGAPGERGGGSRRGSGPADRRGGGGTFGSDGGSTFTPMRRGGGAPVR